MKASFRTSIRWLLSAAALLAAAQVARALPGGSVGAAYSYQITTTPAAPAGTVYSATNLPPGLGIGASTGLISGVPTAAGTYGGTLSLTANSATNNYAYSIAIAGAAGTPSVTSASTASGTVNSAFNYTAAASPAAISYTISGLPAGLSANGTTGVISGTPVAAGVSTVTISATNNAGAGTPVTLTLTVSPAAGTPAITNAALAITGSTGTPVSYQITASNSPTSFSAAGLPLGLSLDPTTGTISGTPSVNGTATVSLAATNSAGTGPAASLAITIGAYSSVTSAATAAATQSSPFSFQLTASPAVTSFNVAGLPNGLLASNSGLISGTPTVAGVFPLTVSANNGVGTGPSTTVTLTVAVAGSGGGGGTSNSGPGYVAVTPVISGQPASVTVTVGGSAAFSVSASAPNAYVSYQWLFNGTALPGQTSSTLALSTVSAAVAGSYSVVVTATNFGGSNSVSSSAAQLAVTALPLPVTISTQPISQSVNVGGTVSFSVAASGSGSLTYQWSKNGGAIAGATGSTLTLNPLSAADAANYSVVVSNGTSSATSNAAVLTVTIPPAPTRLINVSISGVSGVIPQNLVVGLTVGGTGSKSVLFRAVGPTLATFGVGGILADPQLSIVSAGTAVGANDNWGGGPALAAAFAQTGAFALPVASQDAAVLLNLNAGASYTANVSGANGTTGVVLLEAYDADTAASPSARFINLSARATAGSGSNVMTIGFVISGTASKSLLIRGIGPTLGNFGVAGALASTQLSLFQGQTVISSNTGWGGSAVLSSAFNAVSAFALPAGSLDSALLVNLAPGLYTAQLTAAPGSSSVGVALLELYELP
jgi:hypothetical protein